MRAYALRLDRYEIGRELYNELMWFCRQYPAKRAELSAIRGGFNSFAINGQPRGGSMGNPTEARALRALELARDVEDVELAAMEADEHLQPYIIKHVTMQVGVTMLEIPCGLNQFYAARRRFYWCLARRRGKLVKPG